MSGHHRIFEIAESIIAPTLNLAGMGCETLTRKLEILGVLHTFVQMLRFSSVIATQYIIPEAVERASAPSRIIIIT